VLLPGCHGVGSVAGAATREADRIGYLVLISQRGGGKAGGGPNRGSYSADSAVLDQHFGDDAVLERNTHSAPRHLRSRCL
jgi:acetyl/propionyl-CoA carboxylase alpha subunit